MPPKTATKRKRASRKAKPKTKGLEALDCKLEISAEPLREVVTRVQKQGGAIVGSCRDPLGGSPLAIAVASCGFDRTDTFSTRSVRSSPQKTRRCHRENRNIPGSHNQCPGTERRVLDAQWPPPA